MTTPDALRRLEALAETALKLARTAPSGRLALARLADAIEPEWMPEPWRSELPAELRAAREATCVPLSRRDVERALRSAWGGRPTDELDDLDSEPVAVTPIAQVHRGVLGGEPVAVKVLRPRIAAGVRQDLALLDGLLRPIADAFPAVDARGIVRELAARVLEELDLEHEADVQRRFHRALRDHPAFVVPAAHTALARENVLVSAWVDGTLIARSADPDAAAAQLVRFVLGATRFGTGHANPHVEDALVLADGRLAVLDFGATRMLDPARVDDGAAALDALAQRDGAALGAALERLGWLPADAGPAALELAVHALGDLAGPGPSRLDSDAVCAA
ncbi:MAG TPA: AarF/UbiB family protein, partial [Solirubrobacteraceae bacterium]